MNENKRNAFRFVGNFGTIIGLLVMIVIFAILSPKAFPTINNFLNVFNNASLLAIIASGLAGFSGNRLCGNFFWSV